MRAGTATTGGCNTPPPLPTMLDVAREASLPLGQVVKEVEEEPHHSHSSKMLPPCIPISSSNMQTGMYVFVQI